jgi:membrane protein implicated in regulation of membrane protease activity
MIDWWNSLQLVQQIFYGIGIVALVVTLLGIGGDAMGVDFDVSSTDADHSSGLGIFSMQTISAFFLAFGWTGAVALDSALPLTLTVGIAFVAGVVLMFFIYKMIRMVLRLQSKGNLDYSNAIGQIATVYVTIPGNNDDGGQIQVNIQDRLTTASARKQTAGAIKTGQQVKITGMLDQSSFIVEEL